MTARHAVATRGGGAGVLDPAPVAPPGPVVTVAAGRRPLPVSTAVVLGGLGSLTLATVTSGHRAPDVAMVTIGLLGMALVVTAWLLLGRRIGAMSARQLYAVLAAWSLPLLFARPLFSGDVWSYIAQGTIAKTGLDPYVFGPLQALGADSAITQHVSHHWVGTPAPYGPAWLALSRWVADVCGGNLTAGVMLYRSVALIGVALTAWALPRLARRAGVQPSAALWLGVLNPLVLWHLVAGVHNDGIMLGLMLAGMELALGAAGRRPAVVGLRIVTGLGSLTIAANVKVVGFAAVACLTVDLARRYGRPVATVLGMILGCAAGTVAISLGSGLGFGWIGALHSSAGLHSWLAPTNVLGFAVGGLGRLGGVEVTSSAISAAVLVGAALCAVVVATLMLAIHRGRLGALHGLGLIFAVVVVCGPVVQPWYLLWAVLPLAAAAPTGRIRTAVAVVSATIAMALPAAGSGAPLLVSGYLAAGLLFGGGFLVLRWSDSVAGVAVGASIPRPRTVAAVE